MMLNHNNLIIFLFVFCFLSSPQVNSQTITSLQDSIAFKNFDGSLYRGSSFNYMAVENEDGILFIGNENGLLEFDGASWQLHYSDNFSPVTNIKIVGDKIYTVGTDEIGYFQRDFNGVMKYTSIREKSDITDVMRLFHFINVLDGKIYFNSYKHFVFWDGELLKQINVVDAHSFKVGNQIVISTYGKGLAVLQDDTLHYVNTDFKFHNDAAFNILKNSEDDWIIFTSESGFYKLDTVDFSTTQWESEANEYFTKGDKFLYDIKVLRDSLFIASTYSNGITIFNEDGKILQHVDEKNGLSTKYNNIPLVDRRGNVWLANDMGLDYIKWINPDEKFSFKPQTVISRIKSNDSTVYIKKTDQKIEFTGEPIKSISFLFATPSFITEDLEYSYFLEGFDDDWADWNTDVRKEYTNLPGGTFTFRVKARHIHLNHLNIEPFQITVSLPTPWYLNVWNYFLIAIALSGLVFLVIKYRTRKLTRINKKLESMVEQRTHEFVVQQEQLKFANEELKTLNEELDNFVYRSSHDLVAPLKSLRGLIQVAQIDTKEESRTNYFRLMNTSINKLEDFIKSIMDFSTNSKKPIELKEINLDMIIDGIVDDIKYYEKADKIRLIRLYDSDFTITTDAKRLHIVLSNLVTNAVKYHNYHQEDELYIKVSAQKMENYYQIYIEDNGQGIPEEHHEKIFNMFFRAHQGVEGSGLGLYIVVDTLNMLAGKISFTSKVRQGTKFKITLPIPQAFN